MNSHKIELELQVFQFNNANQLQHTYLYPFEHVRNDELNISVYEKDEKVREINLPVRSFVQGFGQQLTAFLAGQNSSLSLFGGGAVSTSVDMVNPFAINAPLGSGNFGIVAGTGSTAVSFLNTTLNSVIVHGTGSAQMEYGATTFGSASAAGTGSYKFTVARTLSNNSTGNITIRETGIVAKDSLNNTFLILRDTLDLNNAALNFLVEPSQTAVITYTFYVDDRGYLTENFLKALYSEMSLLPVNFKSTTFVAASQSLSFNEGNHLAVSQVAAAIDTWGIVVGSGSGSSPTVIDSYKLFAQYPHGSTAGALVYGSGSGDTLITSTGSGSISFYRVFTNSATASTASIKEVGVYVHGDPKSGGNFQNTQTDHKICIIRVPINQVNLYTYESILTKFTLNLKALN